MGRTGFKDGYQQTTTNYPKNVLTFPSERGYHPTQKPLSLFEYLVLTYTNEGDLILDPFMGSGTTLVAANNLKRKAVGIELSQQYCDIAIKRIKENR